MGKVLLQLMHSPARAVRCTASTTALLPKQPHSSRTLMAAIKSCTAGSPASPAACSAASAAALSSPAAAASRWNVYMLAPAAAKSLTHCKAGSQAGGWCSWYQQPVVMAHPCARASSKQQQAGASGSLQCASHGIAAATCITRPSASHTCSCTALQQDPCFTAQPTLYTCPATYLCRVGDHEVHIEESRCVLAQALHNGGAQRQVGHKVAVLQHCRRGVQAFVGWMAHAELHAHTAVALQKLSLGAQRQAAAPSGTQCAP